MKKPKRRLTTREQYEKAKRYDRQQFDDFLLRIWQQGFDEGRKSVPGVELSDVLGKIEQVKGVGPKLKGRIETAVEELYNEG